MAGIKISELPEASCVVGDELVAIVQDSCTKFVAASAIGATGDSTITSVIAGCGLQGGGSFGAVTLHMDANCFCKYEGTTSTVRSTSACWNGAYTTVQANSASWIGGGGGGSGTVTCVDSGDGLTGGPVTTAGALAVDSTVVRTTGNQTIGGTKTFTGDICTSGDILSAGVNLDQLFGSGGGGGISTASAGLSTNGTNVGIDSGTLTPFNQSSCPGLDCVGTVTNVATGDGLQGGPFSSTGTIEVDSTVVRTTGTQNVGGCKNFTGNILSAGTDLMDLFSAGGGGVDTGTACRITRYNTGGSNVEDSNILDSSTLLTIDVDTVINGSLSAIDQITTGTSNIICAATGTLSGGSNFIIGGDNNTVAEAATELSHSGIVGGTRNVVDGGCNNVIIGGELNCLCCNADASFTGNSIVGTMSSCIAGECSGVYSSANVSVAGSRSVVIGGKDHTTLCDDGYVFGGVCNEAGGTFSTIVGGCKNCSGTFLNSLAIVAGGACNCAQGDRTGIIGGFRNSVGATDSGIIAGCNNTVSSSGNMSVIAGGQNNQVLGGDCWAFIGGGSTNKVCQDYSAIVGGNTNTTTEQASFIGGGALNNILNAGAQGAVIGGCSNTVNHNSSVIAGGTAITSVSGCMLHTEQLYAKNLPLTDPGVPGVVWNDSGTLKISN